MADLFLNNPYRRGNPLEFGETKKDELSNQSTSFVKSLQAKEKAVVGDETRKKEKKRKRVVDGKKNPGNYDNNEDLEKIKSRKLIGSQLKSDQDVEAPQMDLKSTSESPDNSTSVPEPDEGRTVFVGNLPKGTKKKAILREFCQVGAVQSVRIRSIPIEESKLPRRAAVLSGKVLESGINCNAYVVFESEASVEPALQRNMTMFLGRHIRVDRVAVREGQSPSAEYDPSRTLFVGNLPFDAEEEELLSLFSSKEGEEASGKERATEVDRTVEAVRVLRDKDSRKGRGIALVLFRSKAHLQEALLLEGVKLRDRPLRLTRARKLQKEAPKKLQGKPSSNRGVGGKIRKEDEQSQLSAQKVHKRTAAPWEGVRATKAQKTGKLGKGIAGKVRAAGHEDGTGRPKESSSKPPKGVKRPAVAARKLASLARKEQSRG